MDPSALVAAPALAASLAIAAALVAVVRRARDRARRRADRALGGEPPLLRHDAARGLGRESAGRGQVRGNGVLAVTDDLVVFCQWMPARDLVIPREAVVLVDTCRSHLGKRVGRDLLRIAWTTPEGAVDRAAWQVPDLDRWRAVLG